MKLNKILFIILGILIIVTLLLAFNKKKEGATLSTTVYDISGSWYGEDLISGPIVLTQDGNKIQGNYTYEYSGNSNKPITETGGGEGTINGDTITWTWKDSNTTITGTILSTPNGSKYDYKQFNNAYAGVWPWPATVNTIITDSSMGTLDECKLMCDKNSQCEGFSFADYSKPNTAQKCEGKRSACSNNYISANQTGPVNCGLWAYGCGKNDDVFYSLPTGLVYCINASASKNAWLGKIAGTGVPLAPTVTGIKWNNKLQTTWKRTAPALPQFAFPTGYTQNAGECGASTKEWNELEKSFIESHSSPSQDFGILSNADCANNCNNDDRCYAFQNWQTIQPSPCTLFYENISSFKTDGPGKGKNISCYVKTTPPAPPPPIIYTPEGYNSPEDGCCGAPGNTNLPQNARDLDDKIADYESKTADECAVLCNQNDKCGAFSINRLKQPSECILWPKGFTPVNGTILGVIGGCETQNSCYTKFYPKSLPDSIKSTGRFAPPLPLKGPDLKAPPTPAPAPSASPSTSTATGSSSSTISSALSTPSSNSPRLLTRPSHLFNIPLPKSGNSYPVIPKDKNVTSTIPSSQYGATTTDYDSIVNQFK